MKGFADKKTKFVATIGPASNTPETIKDLICAGVDVMRLNFSHGTHEEHARVLKDIRRISNEVGKPVGIIQDLCGPKLRVGNLPEQLCLKEGDEVMLTGALGENKDGIPITYANLSYDVHPGETILLDDGLIELRIEEIKGRNIYCTVIVGGLLSSHKGINLPGVTLSVPALTDKDLSDLDFAFEYDVDYIALSFVKDVNDVHRLKSIISKNGKDIPVIAKIEKHEAVNDIDNIVCASDALMVARGDLGVEIPYADVPFIQKLIVEKCFAAGKQVIVATQMLDSMVRNVRPTRAEVTDVANAILDGADAVMLSAETAVGKHPVEAVSVLRNIAIKAESRLKPKISVEGVWVCGKHCLVDAISHAACQIGADLNAAVLLSSTQSGSTARMVSRFKPVQPIIAISPHLNTVLRLTLAWGVFPYLTRTFTNVEDMINIGKEVVLSFGWAKEGDVMVITAGIPLEQVGTTNMIKVGNL